MSRESFFAAVDRWRHTPTTPDDDVAGIDRDDDENDIDRQEHDAIGDDE